jgi:hypothetical protein
LTRRLAEKAVEVAELVRPGPDYLPSAIDSGGVGADRFGHVDDSERALIQQEAVVVVIVVEVGTDYLPLAIDTADEGRDGSRCVDGGHRAVWIQEEPVPHAIGEILSDDLTLAIDPAGCGTGGTWEVDLREGEGSRQTRSQRQGEQAENKRPNSRSGAHGNPPSRQR